MYDVVIIGAGASGVMAACLIKEKNPLYKVLLLEKNDKIGKKILITGNGRCNLGNTNIDVENYNVDINKFGDLNDLFDEYLAFLQKIGIVIKEDTGRLYPYNNQAISVCKSFERYLNKLDVEIKYNYNVNEVIKYDDKYIINNEIKAHKVVISTGGLSYPKTGSTGMGYEILKQFNHSINSTYPALTYLNTDYKLIKELDGVRFNGIVSLYVNNELVDSEYGQIQFTKNALSGICIFNVSSNVKKYLEEKKEVIISVDLVKEYNISEYLYRFMDYKLEEALSGILNNKLAYVISKELKLHGYIIKELNHKQIKSVDNLVHHFNFNIVDVGDYNVSQVTKGGAKLEEFTNNLESIHSKGLYASGEVLDVDGKCGGYNLAWAFISAILISKEI